MVFRMYVPVNKNYIKLSNSFPDNNILNYNYITDDSNRIGSN